MIKVVMLKHAKANSGAYRDTSGYTCEHLDRITKPPAPEIRRQFAFGWACR
jgi:hypothetical protein